MFDYVWVYYNDKNGNIEKISPKLKESNNLKYLQVRAEDVAEIFSGKKSLDDFKVLFELSKRSYFLKEIKKQVEHVNINYVLYKIPEVTNNEKVDIRITQDIKRKKWSVQIDTALYKELRKLPIDYNHKIVLYITHKNDPNILYRTLTTTLENIMLHKKVSFDFNYASELNSSVYTSKYFNSYAHRITK